MEIKKALKKVRENYLRKVRINELLEEDGSDPIYGEDYLAGMHIAILEMEDYLGLNLDEEDYEEI